MRFPALAIMLAVASALGGCSRTTWVDADPTGCDAQLVAHINARRDASRQGAAICAAHGDPGFAGKFRCRDNVMQAQCRR
jgi:hypothetical protein